MNCLKGCSNTHIGQKGFVCTALKRKVLHLLIKRIHKGIYHLSRASKIVGLSNICYTMLNKFLQDSLWGFPSQRSHRKLIVVSAVIDLELP